jgi:hypothetical protein
VFTESQRAALRLRAARDRAEALVEELTLAQQQAEEMIRNGGDNPDDLRVDIGREAMRRALASARRMLESLNAAVDLVERGEVDPGRIDLDDLDSPAPDEDGDADSPTDDGQGPQFP